MAKPFLSIGTKIIFLVLTISLISIAVTTALAFNLADSILKTNVEKTLAEESQERGTTISSIVKERIEGVKLFATNSVLVEALSASYPGLDNLSDAEHFAEERESIENIVKSFQQDQFSAGIKDLTIFNRLGIPVFSLNAQDIVKIETLPASERKLAKTSTKFIQDDDNERLLKISSPIINNENGSSIGRVVVTTHTTVFDSVLLNRFGLQETGEVYLVNRDRMMISESLFVEDAPFQQQVDSEPVRLCFEGGQSVSGMTYVDYRGVEIFGISYCENNLGFVMLTEVDESVVLEPIYELQQTIVIMGASIMAIASVAAFIISSKISNPIQKLRDATQEISKGNFDVQTNIQTNDEIGELSSSFDSMANAIKETISAITKRENIIKQQANILLKYSEQKQECCVCLVDIVGSILIKEKMSEEESKKYYSVFIESVAEIVEQYNGIAVKAVDDSLLFYFPLKDDTTYENAVDCCLAIADYNSELNEKLTSEDLPEIAYRISSTFGDVNVTKSSTATLQDIFGEPVNHCFNINQYALPNTLVIGDSMYQKVKDSEKLKFTKLDQSLIKGLEYKIFIVTRK
ncbi:cache domain-containing protein [Nitrosopumilus sp.]|uniref:cache domain-containing protein n=1 Tax=Nitrosopumilus sp. TaxID=2024843 RepID=UPI003B5AD901